MSSNFSDAGTFQKLAFFCAVFGCFLDVFGFTIYTGAVSRYNDSDGCFIASFVAFVVGVILIVGLIFVDEFSCRVPGLVIFVIIELAAGVLVIVGLAIVGSRGNNNLGPYFATVNVCAGFLGILAGIFGILDLAGCSTR